MGSINLEELQQRINSIETINTNQTTQITQLLAILQQQANIDSIPMEQLIEWLAINPIIDGVTESQLQAILNLISTNNERDDLQQQQIDNLLDNSPITQEQLNELFTQNSAADDDLSNVTAITKEQLDELLNEKGEDD